MRPEIDPKVDYAFKRLFGSDGTKPILIDVLNAVTQPSLGLIVRAITLLNPSTEKGHGEDKQTVFDVRASDQGNRQFTLEMQRRVAWYFAKRALFGWSMAYAAQLRAGEHHATLQPTYTICFLEENLYLDEHFHHVFRMADLGRGVLMCKDAELHTVELGKFDLTAEQIATPLDRWCYFLKHAAELDTERLPTQLDVPVIHQAMEVLMRIHENEADHQHYLSRRMAELDEHFRQNAHAYGLQEGMEKGEEKGIELGMEKGKVIGQIHLAQRLLKQPMTAMEVLAKLPFENLVEQARQLEQLLLGSTPP